MLVDTSVWIDHFRRSHRPLVGALERGDVQCHDYVVGELACGTLPLDVTRSSPSSMLCPGSRRSAMPKR